MKILSTKEVSYWRSKETNVRKDLPSLPGKSTTVKTKDGLSDTVKTTEVTSKEKERTDTLDLSSMSHSMPLSKEKDQ
jgi:hypothetical protein